jgi:hypothetical protein
MRHAVDDMQHPNISRYNIEVQSHPSKGRAELRRAEPCCAYCCDIVSVKSMLSSPALLRIQWLPKRAVRSPKCVWMYAKRARPPPAQHPIEKPRAYEHSFAKEVMPSLDKMQLEESDHGAPCVSKLGAHATKPP